MLNDVKIFCLLLNEFQTYMPRKAYQWAMIFLKIILLSFLGLRAVVN